MMPAIDIDGVHADLNNGGVTKSDKVIGRRARLIRLDQGWTQDQLARKAGVTRNTVRAFERGLGKTRKANSEKIAAALGTTLGALEAMDEGRLGPAKWSVLLRDLNREDLIIARAYHHAATKTRHRVLSHLHELEAENEESDAEDGSMAATATRAAELADFIAQLRDETELRMIEGVAAILRDKRHHQLAERLTSKTGAGSAKTKRTGKG